MTAPLSYIFGDNPTNTHYCLLCAQEECWRCRGTGECQRGHNGLDLKTYGCNICKATGSKLVPITEHDVDHEHVTATALMFLGRYATVESNGKMVIGGLTTYLAENFGLTQADLWQMAKAVGGFLNVSRVYQNTAGCVAGHEAICDLVSDDLWNPDWDAPSVRQAWQQSDDEAVIRALIAQEYETWKERVKG